ncbi:MFS transporter [Cryptosporangium japonicum]|uniref:MFS transporter n=2 Tax=Cryptosporangium japonicum TaxID=80872 RepID=A0ABN0V175_9ACTN
MSAGQISVLFGIWSFVGFVLEVPSGALADRIPRRHLLVAGVLIRAGAFASWILWPTFPGFALGFVLWGAGGAASSGTWEALVYDELTRYGTADRYARFLGRAEALSAAGSLAGTALAAPLMALGGYPLVGWTSVAVCLLATALASRLPVGHPPTSYADHGTIDANVDRTEGADAEPGYLDTLRSGLREAVVNRRVGRVVLVVVLLSGVTAVEEYFGLLAADLTSPAVLPLLLLLPTAGYTLGAEFGGRLGGIAPRRLAVTLTVGVVLVAAGALIRHPLGFVALGVGFGLVGFGIVVAGARLQETLTGPRATVTSVANVGEEVVALAVFGAFGAAAGTVSLPLLTALAVVPLLVLTLRVPRWLPPAQK